MSSDNRRVVLSITRRSNQRTDLCTQHSFAGLRSVSPDCLTSLCELYGTSIEHKCHFHFHDINLPGEAAGDGTASGESQSGVRADQEPMGERHIADGGARRGHAGASGTVEGVDAAAERSKDQSACMVARFSPDHVSVTG